jgi:hypothetical protein
VIPGLLLLAMWALAWSYRKYRRLGYGRKATGSLLVAASLVLLVPIGIAAGGLMFSKTEKGEVAAVDGLCQRLGPGASVLIVERATGEMFSQVVRSMCGLPTARVVYTGSAPAESDVRRVIRKIISVGRRPVLLGADPGNVSAYGTPELALHLKTRVDGHTLTWAPRGTWSREFKVWMAEPGALA